MNGFIHLKILHTAPFLRSLKKYKNFDDRFFERNLHTYRQILIIVT